MQWSCRSCSPNPFKFPTLTGVSSGAGNYKAPLVPKHLHLRLNLPIFHISFFKKLRGSNFNTTRKLCELIQSRWVHISWGFPSWIVYMYCICLCLVAEAHDDQFSSVYYACEDVQNYYAGVQHLTGEKLKEKLNIIISEHQTLPYTKIWDAIKILDAADVDVLEASSDVVEIYSLQTVPKSLAGKPYGWNRPQMRMVMQLLPHLVYRRAPEAIATKEAAPDTETDKKSWAPPLQVRGDIARALMYMAVCYGFPQADRGVNLRLSDFPRTENSEMGLLTTLLRWNNLDPPSREEKLRNERVCKIYQHNRNPFIDHPEYASLIWEQVP